MLYFLAAILAALLAARGLVVYGDVANLISNAFYVALTLLFYRMFLPVRGNLSLLAALCSLTGCLIQVLAVVHRAPFHIDPFIFFGPYCILLGYLIVRSTFLPKALGILMALAGFGWLASLSPPLANRLSSSIEVLAFLAECSLMLWLLTLGVNVPHWAEKTKQATRLLA